MKKNITVLPKSKANQLHFFRPPPTARLFAPKPRAKPRAAPEVRPKVRPKAGAPAAKVLPRWRN